MNEINIAFLETNQTAIYGAPCRAYNNYFMQKEIKAKFLNMLIDLDDENSVTVELHAHKHPLKDQNMRISSIYDLHFALDNAE